MFYPETQIAANDVITKNQHLLASHRGRVAVLREAVRVAGRMNFEHFSESVGWRTHVTLITSASSLVDEETRGRLVAALRATESMFIDRTAQFYGAALSGLGFSFRPGATAELLAGWARPSSKDLRSAASSTRISPTRPCCSPGSTVSPSLGIPPPSASGESSKRWWIWRSPRAETATESNPGVAPMRSPSLRDQAETCDDLHAARDDESRGHPHRENRTQR